MSEQVKEEGSFKIKKKPKQLVKNDIIKVDLSKKEEPKKETDAIQVGETKKVVVEEQTGNSPKVDEQVPESSPISEVEEEVKPVEQVIEEEIIELGEKIEEKVIAPTPEEAREVANYLRTSKKL